MIDVFNIMLLSTNCVDRTLRFDSDMKWKTREYHVLIYSFFFWFRVVISSNFKGQTLCNFVIIIIYYACCGWADRKFMSDYVENMSDSKPKTLCNGNRSMYYNIISYNPKQANNMWYTSIVVTSCRIRDIPVIYYRR